jgi:hypothetical protein
MSNELAVPRFFGGHEATEQDVDLLMYLLFLTLSDPGRHEVMRVVDDLGDLGRPPVEKMRAIIAVANDLPFVGEL